LALPQARRPSASSPSPIQEHGHRFSLSPRTVIWSPTPRGSPYYEPNESELRGRLLRQASSRPACREPPEKQKTLRGEQPSHSSCQIATRGGEEEPDGILPNREIFVADVKALQPPLAERSGTHVAAGPRPGNGIRKGRRHPEDRCPGTFPTLALVIPTRPARPADPPLGFPGVVMYHDFLDRRSAVEAQASPPPDLQRETETRAGRRSSDGCSGPLGNSGGPAVNDEGQVVASSRHLPDLRRYPGDPGLSLLGARDISCESSRAPPARISARPVRFKTPFGTMQWTGSGARTGSALRAAGRGPPAGSEPSRCAAGLQAEPKFVSCRTSGRHPLWCSAQAARLLPSCSSAPHVGGDRDAAAHATRPPRLRRRHRSRRSFARQFGSLPRNLARALGSARTSCCGCPEPSAYERSSVQAKGANSGRALRTSSR